MLVYFYCCNVVFVQFIALNTAGTFINLNYIDRKICTKGKIEQLGIFIVEPVTLLRPTRDQLMLTKSKKAGPGFTPQETVRIGSRIPDKWEKIAFATGEFSDREIAIIRLNNSYHDDALKATIMLTEYQRRLGPRELLVSALKEFGELELAEKVELKHFQTYCD